MNLRALIEERYKNAIKSKNAEETNILRLIKSAIKDKDIENRTKESVEEINDQQIMALLHNLIKQRKDSIKLFKVASREDLISKESYEIDIISIFLPTQLNEQEIKAIIKSLINEQSFSSLKDMGALMTSLKNNHKGSVDMVMAGKIAKSLLNN